MGKSWRDRAREEIRKLIEQGKSLGIEGPALERFVRSQYPFGLREHHPYKIWLDEMRRHFPKPKTAPDVTDHPFLLLREGTK